MKYALIYISLLITFLSFGQKTATVQPKTQNTSTASSNPSGKEKEYMTAEEYEQRRNVPVPVDEGKGNNNAPEVFTMVEEMPEYPGGNVEMYKFIQTNITYPEKAQKEKLSGKCFLKFIVQSDGSITAIHVEKGVPGCPECDAEAIRVIKLMPKWKPGKTSGRAVDVYYMLPFNFKL